MRLTTSALAALATGIGLALAAPYDPFPLKDGFPNPSSSQIAQIAKAAGGSLPNGGLPTTLSDDATVAWQLIALNEDFEVAFYTSLINNITSGQKGYSPSDKSFALKALYAIQAQEQFHALGANAILSSAGKQTVSTCKYMFPTTDYKSAIAFANTFTDVVLSVLPGAAQTAGVDGGQETSLISLIGSIIGQEGQQDGWFRQQASKTPSAAPFLTLTHPVFAYNALKQLVLVPGSCPQFSTLNAAIPTLGVLNILSGASQPYDSTAKFSVNGTVNASDYSIAYLSGVLNPVVVPIHNVSTSNGMSMFSASFPFDSANFSNGLTVASLIENNGANVTSVKDVAQYAKYGPGLIEIE